MSFIQNQHTTSTKTVKYTITELVVKKLAEEKGIVCPYPTEELISAWWVTKNGEGLALTTLGDTYFRISKIPYHDFVFDYPKNKTNHYFLFLLSKKLKAPYSIHNTTGRHINTKNNHIRIYDNKIAVVLSLYGNLEDYINSIK